MPTYRLSELVDLSAVPEFKLHGFLVRRVKRPHDLEAVCRFRHDVYQTEGFLAPGAFPEGTMTDAFDAEAEHIIAYSRKGEICGAMRVTTPSADGLPTQHVFNVDIARIVRAGVIDIGKFAIAKRFRARLLVPFLKAAIEAALANKAPSIVAFFPDKLAESYSELGCPSFVLPELPLSERFVSSRKPLQPYFDHAVIRPRLFVVQRLLQGLGLPAPEFLDGHDFAPKGTAPSESSRAL